jgi:hypothetical protein
VAQASSLRANRWQAVSLRHFQEPRANARQIGKFRNAFFESYFESTTFNVEPPALSSVVCLLVVPLRVTDTSYRPWEPCTTAVLPSLVFGDSCVHQR